MSTPTERRYRREARYSTQLRVTVEPATAAALEAEADAAGLSVSAVIRDAGGARVAASQRRPEEASEPQTEPRDVITWSELSRHRTTPSPTDILPKCGCPPCPLLIWTTPQAFFNSGLRVLHNPGLAPTR